MERKKMTKALIGESLKVLMREHPFEKITIKMITDEAGVIRPTFYNYFCDKYDVLEWIFSESIIEKIKVMFEEGMYMEGIKMLFVCMKNDSQFYKKAFEVTGQNAFADIVKKYLYELFVEEFDAFYYVESRINNPLLSSDMVASYYAISLTNLLQAWIHDSFQEFTADQMFEAYEYLITHRVKDFIDPDRKGAAGK
ncbi:MAG: TetR/AcrR family transcriptional regulator C-terminal domain-containing protein [Coprococcus sp.]